MAVAHFPLERLAAALRADGQRVNILSGAQGRSARNFSNVGYSPRGCQAFVQHHTVSSGDYPDNDIAYILQGNGFGYVIANAYTARDGEITLIASGPTYTEGRGGPRGIIAKDLANPVVFSNEIANPGTGSRDYPMAQQIACAFLAARACEIAADVWDWPDADVHNKYRLFAHFEWAPGRKADPAGGSMWEDGSGARVFQTRLWNMDAHRDSVRWLAGLEPEEPDPPVEPEPPTFDDPTVTDSIYWYISKDDTPWGVATVAYGSGAQNGRLDHSKFSSFSTPGSPHFVQTPGVAGTMTTIRDGEGAGALIQRLTGSNGWPSAASFDTFYTWNGGGARFDPKHGWAFEGEAVSMPSD